MTKGTYAHRTDYKIITISIIIVTTSFSKKLLRIDRHGLLTGHPAEIYTLYSE